MSHEKLQARTEVLNLWDRTPYGAGCQKTLPQGLYIRYPAYQIFILRFITAAKLQVWSSNENNFKVVGHHNTRNCKRGRGLGRLRATAPEHDGCRQMEGGQSRTNFILGSVSPLNNLLPLYLT